MFECRCTVVKAMQADLKQFKVRRIMQSPIQKTEQTKTSNFAWNLSHWLANLALVLPKSNKQNCTLHPGGLMMRGTVSWAKCLIHQKRSAAAFFLLFITEQQVRLDLHLDY